MGFFTPTTATPTSDRARTKWFTAAVTLMVSGVATAGDPPVYSQCSTAAASGADVVAYHSLEAGADAIIGSERFSHEWNGATWHFANDDNRARFAANPEKYAPAYGGYCAFAASHGFTQYSVPDAWEIIDDTLYLNKSKGINRRWKKKHVQRISEANQNWPTLLNACEKHDNCRPCWKR